MTLPSPRITPLCKIAHYPPTGLHALAFNDGIGTGNHAMLWRDGEEPWIMDLPDAGFPVASVALSGNALYVVAGQFSKGYGPFRITAWNFNSGVKLNEFVFGTTDTYNVSLVQSKAGLPICVAVRKHRSDMHAEFAFVSPLGWESRVDSYGNISGSNIDTFNFTAIEGPDGNFYITIKQDGGQFLPLLRYKLSAAGFSFLDTDPQFWNVNVGDSPNGELPTFESAVDGNEVLMSFQSGYLGPICGMNAGQPAVIGISTIHRTKRTVAKIFNEPVQVYSPGIPVFVTPLDIWFMTFSWRRPECTRRWLVWRLIKETSLPDLERVIEIADPRFFTWSPDGWLFYRATAGAPWILEKLFNAWPVPTPVPVPVPTPTPVPVPVPPTGLLTITTDMPEYQARQTIVIRFKSLPETIINGLVEPSNSKKPGVEQRDVSIAAETDETGLLVARVVIKPSWKGPIKIEAEATKDAYSIGKATIYVPIV